MRVTIVSRDHRLQRPEEEWIRRRLEFALGRFGARIRAAKVRLKDLNGPRGGLDQACGLDVQLVSGELLTVESVQECMEAAASAAFDRMARRLREEFNRRRDVARGTPASRG